MTKENLSARKNREQLNMLYFGQTLLVVSKTYHKCGYISGNESTTAY